MQKLGNLETCVQYHNSLIAQAVERIERGKPYLFTDPERKKWTAQDTGTEIAFLFESAAAILYDNIQKMQQDTPGDAPDCPSVA